VTSRDDTRPTVDRRVLRTRATLQRTLSELVQERDLSQVTIADIAERAGTSRSTFYDHYRDVHELAEAACTTAIDDLVETLRAFGSEAGTPGPTSSLTLFFANFADHAGLYRSLLGPQGSARVVDHIRTRLTATVRAGMDHAAGGRPGSAPDVGPAFIAGALIGVATEWLQRGCPGTPADAAGHTWPLLVAAHNSMPCSPPAVPE
jgi:AcrR family transcriptional regulator